MYINVSNISLGNYDIESFALMILVRALQELRK